MSAALDELRSQSPPALAVVARKYNITRSVLSKRFHGKAVSKELKTENDRALNNQQEQQLISWIQRQSDRCLPPTPALVTKIASDMAGHALSGRWASRFVARHKDKLDSNYLNNLDLARHKADSRDSYEMYFERLGQFIEKHGVTAENMYNIDEKGFMIGVCQKTRRIFTKRTFEGNGDARAGQDGNREWVTVLAAICADGTSLSPAVIYKAVSGDIQDDWLQDFDPNEHSCFFASTPNGWTSDELGLAWLEQIFNKETKSKAGRSWRLLFVDGHSSHLNMKFTERCHELRILLVYYPPHSTHRLQPLDVSCFNPLANYYSQSLNDLIMQTAGFTAIRKRDFFSLFWTAYEKTFNKKIIGSAFEKTGIWPFNPSIVLDKLPLSQQLCHRILTNENMVARVRQLF